MKRFLPLLAVLTAAACITGAFHLPYSYYMLLRCMATATALFLMLCHGKRLPQAGWVPLLVIALLFNPVVKVHLVRSLWAVIDTAAALVFGWLAVDIARRAKT